MSASEPQIVSLIGRRIANALRGGDDGVAVATPDESECLGRRCDHVVAAASHDRSRAPLVVYGPAPWARGDAARNNRRDSGLIVTLRCRLFGAALAPREIPLYFSAMNRVKIAFESMRRESENGIGHAFGWFLQRFMLRFLRRRFPALPPPTKADRMRAVTVLIPAAEKDADLLEACLRSVRENVAHPITALWVVAPESDRLRAVAAAHQAQFIHEDTLLPKPAKELNTRGWMLQQLIKLNAAHRVPTEDYLVLDADTVFLREQIFFRGSNTVLRYSDQYELLYNRSLALILGHRRRFPVSFVTHHAMFSRTQVCALLAMLDARFKRPWWQALLDEVDQGHLISFSEYELYGHFIVAQPDWRKRFVLEYWNGLDLDGSDATSLEHLRATAGPRCNSASFHRHTQ